MSFFQVNEHKGTESHQTAVLKYSELSLDSTPKIL